MDNRINDVDLLEQFNVLDFPYDTYNILPERYKKKIYADDYNKHNQDSKALLINFMVNNYFDKEENSVGPWATRNYKIKDSEITLTNPCFMANVKIQNATYAKILFASTTILSFVKIDNTFILPDCTRYSPLYNMGNHNPIRIETDGDSLTFDFLHLATIDINNKFETFINANYPVITYRCPSQNCAIINGAKIIKYNYNNNFIYTRYKKFIQILLSFLNKKITNKYLLLEIVNNGVNPKWLTDYEIFELL